MALKEQVANQTYRKRANQGAPTTNVPTDDDNPYNDKWPPQFSGSSARRYQQLQDLQDEFLDDVSIQTQEAPPVLQRRKSLPYEGQRAVINNVPCVFSQGQWRRLRVNNTAMQVAPPAPLPEKKRHHWLFWLGIIFCIMLIGWTAFSALSGFIQAKRNDLLYGYPRTFHIDANVGHNGRESHFDAENLNGYVEIFETQRGHPEAAKNYIPTVLTINPTDPVTLLFQDVNGDGKPDMIITAPSFQTVMFNNGTSFQAQPPGK